MQVPYALSPKPCGPSRGWGAPGYAFSWVAVKELKLSYHNGL